MRRRSRMGDLARDACGGSFVGHALDAELWRADGWSYRALGRPRA